MMVLFFRNQLLLFARCGVQLDAMKSAVELPELPRSYVIPVARSGLDANAELTHGGVSVALTPGDGSGSCTRWWLMHRGPGPGGGRCQNQSLKFPSCWISCSMLELRRQACQAHRVLTYLTHSFH